MHVLMTYLSNVKYYSTPKYYNKIAKKILYIIKDIRYY